MKYFAYGSNLNQKCLDCWCRNKLACNGLKSFKLYLSNPKIYCLGDYTIGFTRRSSTWNSGVADIIKKKGQYCYGMLFDCKENDLKILDVKEGVKYGSYERVQLCKDIISYEVIKKSKFVQPTDEYLDIIIQGAKEHMLPNAWIDKLEAFRKGQ